MKFEDLNLPDSPYRGYYVNSGGKTVSIDNLDLISHIKDNLYVGGCIHGVDLGDFFSHVFSMYRWEAYKVAPTTKVHTVTMDPGVISFDVLTAIVDNGSVRLTNKTMEKVKEWRG